jgi:predicted nucleic acid-binding protein
VSKVLVLDAGALDALGRSRGRRQQEVRAALIAALRRDARVLVPAVILAELYRGPAHNAIVDSCLARESILEVRDTDRRLARLVGGVLAAASAGSEHLADAHVVAAAVEAGGGLVLTTDPEDLGRLANAYGTVVVRALP